ncbi:DUF2939 domain-containing protein [Phenylobacterium sp.]|uniref:DUF2939 domain-containing protein n=1 Tax=Phenylobacterium sp. TaxID=1871053 RepID=UPI002FC737C5
MDPREPYGWSLGRAVFRLVLALIVGTAVVFATAPFFAFRALKAAARDGDAHALAELVDYRAVRDGLRPQVAAGPIAASAPPDIWSDPIGAVRRAIEPLTPTPSAVEPYLDTRGLYDLTRGYAPGNAPAEARGGFPRLRYWGPNRARFAIAAPGATAPVIFSFQRRDLFSWKLVQVRVPPPP